MPSPRVFMTVLLVLGSVTFFLLLGGLAVASYPGGNWVHGTQAGFHPAHNFLCDLLRDPAIDGTANPVAARAARAAMLILLAGLAGFWVLAPRLLAPSATRYATTVRGLGLVSTVGLVGVPLTAAAETSWLHGPVIVVAGVPGLAAAIGLVVGTISHLSVPRWFTWLGMAAIGVSLADFLLYVDHLLRTTPVGPLLPTLQGLAVGLILAWMVSASLLAWRWAAVAARGDGAPPRSARVERPPPTEQE